MWNTAKKMLNRSESSTTSGGRRNTKERARRRKRKERHSTAYLEGKGRNNIHQAEETRRSDMTNGNASDRTDSGNHGETV